jgi:uncharacterized repeat protein (TIGR03803 family)
MKMKMFGVCAALVRRFGLPIGLLLCQTLSAAVTFTVTPSAVSNTYNGTITLQISGIPTGDTVVVQKFLDLNTNGVIDGTDWLVQQFNLTDGQAGMVIGGVTNFNVPGDLNATTGAITATLNFQNGDFVQNIVGNYLYKLSSPVGHFAPITNSFIVTNFPYAQEFTGNVVSKSTSNNVPNAVVLLFPGQAGNSSPQAGTVANNSGNYTVPAPPGTYSLLSFSSNFVANMNKAPLLTLAASQTITNNLTLTNATASISGSVVDASNFSTGLPGVLFPVKSTNGLIAVAFTDTNGNFNVPVTAGNWQIKADDTALIVHGYLGLQTDYITNAGATGVTVAVPEATALIYGSVKDNLGNPLVGLDVYANDNNNLYETDAYTDTNGNYVVGVLGLGADDSWYVQANGNNTLTNYVFSQQNGNVNINVGQAVLQNFTAILATNYITGNVTANGTNIVDVGVNASATINGTNFDQYVDTDTNGNYSLNVVNGTWDISVNCNGGSDSLDNILGSGNYICPNDQFAVISGNNATNNFIVQLGPLQVTTTSLPNGTNGIFYSQQLGASGGQPPYNWSLSPGSGSLPPGLSLATNGVLSGIPVLAGTFDFSVRVTDSASNTVDQPLSLTISIVPLQVTTTSLPNAALGVFYSQQLGASGGQPPYNWSLSPGSGSLPPGLSLVTNGVLSGMPTINANFYFSVRVTDFLSDTMDQGLELTVVALTNLPLTTLYSFSGVDGSSPNGLVQGSDGNFYGTTEYGGAYTNQYSEGLGTVFTITPLGTLNTLYSFSGIDGAVPAAGLVQGTDGNFYGTTEYGGAYEDESGGTFGTVFKIMTNATFTSLYSFSGSDGDNPVAGLVQGADGSLYGTTEYGGVDYYLDDGTVFKITTNGTFISLFWFGGSDGIEPEGGLVQGTDRNFYGTTFKGGTNGLLSDGYGTVFKMTTNGTLSTLYSFTGGNDGANPVAGLVQGTDGNFYGTAEYGGTNGSGTVFKIMTNGTFTSLYSFSGTNGANPAAGLVQGTDGNFYGTTEYGGAYANQYGEGQGTVFKITPGGALTTLYSFTGGSDGAYPNARLVQGTDGNFYGTTSSGGANDKGTIFRFNFASPPQPVFQSVTRAGGTITLTWSALAGQTYQLQFKTNLNQMNWNNLGSVIIATNSAATALDPIGPDPQRFYRVKIGP